MHDVGIVIVNYNMKDQIDRCLASLFLDCKESNLDIRVTVVDNASTDGSVGCLRTKYPTVNFITQSENRGFGAAQNIGLSSCEARYYFVLNPDTYFFPGENVIRKLYDLMEAESKIGMVGPKVVNADGSLQFSCYRFPTLWHPFFSRTSIGRGMGKRHHHQLIMKDYDHQERRPVDWLMGSALFIRGSALEKVGKFDERFWMYYEDSDLCRRFWEAGWGVYYVPEIKIEHAHSRGSAEVPGIIRALLKNRLARVHVESWMKYMWKWRRNYKFYAP